jgi:hypothetical protein
LAHSSGRKRARAAWINAQTSSKVRGRQARKNAFSLAKASSIGLKSGAKSSVLAIQINSLFPQQLRDLCEDAGAP